MIYDDASVETGFGWVPSVIEGIYVQRFEREDFGSQRVEEVCLCWLRTRTDDSLDFDLVFFRDADGEPEAAPYASIPATATLVPQGVTGAWYEVSVAGVELPDGPVYIGARWNANVDQFFFVCADTTPSTPFHNLFFIDDRAEEWGNAADTNDPIFDDYRATMIRAVTAPPHVLEIPTLAPAPLAALAAALGWLAWRRLRRLRGGVRPGKTP